MDGYPALGLHGDKSQQERDWVLQEFKNGTHPIMLATDVAARGLGNVTRLGQHAAVPRWLRDYRAPLAWRLARMLAQIWAYRSGHTSIAHCTLHPPSLRLDITCT